MKKLMIILAVMAVFMAVTPAVAQNYGIVFGDLEVTEENANDIFGDGMASYDVIQNTLRFKDGFHYHLSVGLVTINTGSEFHIILDGHAEMMASLTSDDAIFVEASDQGRLKITSNISGSALKCKALVVKPNVFLDLLSRNSQIGMYALDCDELSVNDASLYAEVTTANLAVKTNRMKLDGCYLQKPAGGGVNAAWGGICFADGTPAKIVRIAEEGTGVPEEEAPSQGIQVKKIFEKGRIVIVKDGKRYDITGREINN